MSLTAPLADRAEAYRLELTGYCYRFLGAASEAEDAVQETLLRAWRSGDSFRGEASLRTWLYRVASNVCIDMQRSAQRRALPMDLTSPGRLGQGPPDLGQPLAPERWVGPIADERILRSDADPAEVVSHRETVRLAFIAALQLLPPRQRAVLILRDVLAFSAAETAELTDLTIDAVTSALSRARATVRARAGSGAEAAAVDPRAEAATVQAYMRAFEAYDVDALVRLLVDDADFTMPPYEFWLRGLTQIERWWRGPGQVCRGSRVLPALLNGAPAVAAYHRVETGWEPFAVHLLELHDDGAAARIAGITHFLGPAVFGQLGLPSRLD